MKTGILVTLLIWLLLAGDRSYSAEFAKGADVSWLPQMEASGFRFYDKEGRPEDCLGILKSYGINTIRLRVFVNPSTNPRSGHCGRDEVVAMALRAHKMGFRILIDFHYSDTWADPLHQKKPAAWVHDSLDQLKEDVFAHTTDVLTALKKVGVTPEWVQVGNEIPSGMLWPDGAQSNGNKLTELINSGYRAVKSVDPETKVIVHLNNGSSNGLYRWFFDPLRQYGARYDVIGLSYYPWFDHKDYTKTIDALGANLKDIAARYDKEVMVVEVGGDSEEPENTRDLVAAVIKKVREVPGGKGLGVIYWEPEAARGWSHYKLSCWGDDGRPTAGMEGFK